MWNDQRGRGTVPLFKGEAWGEKFLKIGNADADSYMDTAAASVG